MFAALSTPPASRSFSRRVLGFALADGPVLKPDIDEVDEDILGAAARCLSEPVDDRLVDLLLLAGRTALVPRDLNDDQVIAAVDAELARIEEEAAGVVFAYDLEAGVVRYSNADGDHRLIDDAADLLTVGRVLALAQVDSNECMISSLFAR